MKIELLTNENFNEKSLDNFDRYQKVTNVYRPIDGEYKLVYHPFEETWSPEHRREKAREILSGEYMTFGAIENGKIIGELMFVPELNDGRMIVESFHVSGECRRQGIGRRLFEAAKAEAKGRGAKQLYISACSAEETVAFYFAMGCYVSKNPIKKYAEDEPCDLQLECDVK